MMTMSQKHKINNEPDRIGLDQIESIGSTSKASKYISETIRKSLEAEYREKQTFGANSNDDENGNAHGDRLSPSTPPLLQQHGRFSV